MVAEMGFLLVQEFRKFMYQNAKEILRWKWNGEMSIEENVKWKDGWYFNAPLTASYYVDLVWKNFIRYDEGYRAYCENLCGGYIDRPEPTENIE